MKSLGDEVSLLFFRCYTNVPTPKLTPANIYEPDPVTKKLIKDIQEVIKNGGSLRYE